MLLQTADIKKIISERVSVRTFDPDKPVPADVIGMMRSAVTDANSPFGGEFTIKLAEFQLKGPQSPGTYGTISGASWYLLMGIGDDELSALSAGYAMERVVLRATELGLGSCWIALTFKKDDFEREVKMPDGEPLRIISPLGYAASKRRLLERMTRAVIRSSSRRSMNELFSFGRWGNDVPEDNKFFQPLAMMRLAPSAKNTQPWRALVEGENVWFYYVKKSEASMLDVGIGLCHFDLTLRSGGVEGEWSFSKDVSFPTAPEGYIPVVRFSVQSR